MKRVLFIAFYFPPRNNIACYRTGCFAKFLPQHGWLPTVVCQDWPADGPDSDSDFVGEFPDTVQIHRIPAPPHRGFYQRVWLRKLAPFLWPHRAPILWWQLARRQIATLLETQQFDAVWATSDPLTPLTLALEASQSAHLPWVADIRDCLNEQKFGSWYKRPLFRHQERRLCRLADRVVTVSEGLSDVLKTFTKVPVSIIPNGFDPSLLPREKPAPSPLFTILYAGTLVMGRQDPRPVFHALQICLSRGLIPRGQIEMQFLGTKPESVRTVLAGFPEDLPVRVLPRVTHRVAVQIQTSASVLLVFAHGSERGIMTGKIFDYLATGRPILAVPDDRDTTSRLLRTTRAGLALNDAESIARQLSEWYSLWRSNPFFTIERNETEVRRYSRSSQAGELARLLDETSNARSAHSR